jgi:hypothetical protein
VATVEANAKDEVSKSLEQVQIDDLQEIEKLRSDLELLRSLHYMLSSRYSCPLFFFHSVGFL